MSPISSTKSSLSGVFMVGSFALLCVAIVAQAQYSTYDSDVNSDSDGNPILTQAELGKLVRNTAKLQAAQSRTSQSQQQLSAATRNLYNRQQPMQFAPSYNKRSNSFGSQSDLNGYQPAMGASHGRQMNANSDQNDDDEGSSSGPSFGQGFGSSFDSANSNNNADSDGEGSSNDNAQPMNLNQAASGYPGQGDYNEAGAGLSGYGQSGFNEGSDFGPSEDFGLDGRRAKSASSPLGSRGFGSDEDSGASQYGPNSAVNSGGDDDEGRSAFASEGNGESNDDDE